MLLLPFFGRWALKSAAEMEHVGGALRELAPEAERAGVILGLENTISAEDNVRIMEMVPLKQRSLFTTMSAIRPNPDST